MEYFFEEDQKFRQWWLWAIMLTTLIFTTIITKFNIFSVTLFFLVLALLYISKLRVKVSNKVIYYQFFPFHLKAHQIRLKEIESFKSITYSPITDYGGWGIRYSFRGTAYNVSGNKGVHIELKSGKKILFGSQRSQEFEDAIRRNHTALITK